MSHSLARKSSAAHILALRVVSRARASLRLGLLEFPSLAAISRSRVPCRLLDIGMLEELLHVLPIVPRRAIVAFALDGIYTRRVRARTALALVSFHVGDSPFPDLRACFPLLRGLTSGRPEAPAPGSAGVGSCAPSPHFPSSVGRSR